MSPLWGNATTFVERPFPESVERAPNIVHGVAGTGRSEWSEDQAGTRRIYTYTDFDVIEGLKGGVPEGVTIQVRSLGGDIDGVGLRVPGTAKFKRGEEVVVFLMNENSDGSYDVKGLMMGRYSVVEDEDGIKTLRGPGMNLGAHHGHHGHSQEKQPQVWTLDRVRKLIALQGDNLLHGEKSEYKDKKMTPHVTSRSAKGEDHQRITHGAKETQVKAGTPLSKIFMGFGISLLVILGFIFFLRRSRI